MFDDDASPPSSQDLANDDFLFHLYRGSELLLDNRVHEAKQELEQALGLQPRDAKGQDLLAIVYFRLGLYPRAIQIYERLVEVHPEATTPRINLALCYLKTGQPQSARSELERVLEQNPEHTRAWGYLGLAFQRLGDVERAVYAFRMGGHEGMARRLGEASPPATDDDAADPASRAAAARVFDELERRGVEFAPDAPTGTAATGSWSALEPGRERTPSVAPRWSFAPSPARPGSLPPPGFTDLGRPLPADPIAGQALRPTPLPRDLGRELTPLEAGVASIAEGAASLGQVARPDPDHDDAPQARVPRSAAPVASGHDEPAARARRALGVDEPMLPVDARRLGQELVLVWPKRERAARASGGAVLLRGGEHVAARLDALRALRLGASSTSAPLSRNARGAGADGVLGGAASPLVSLDGSTQLVLAPPPSTTLVVLQLDARPVFFREAALVALEGDFAWTNARLAQGDAEPMHVVGVSGAGVAVLALPPTTQSLELVPPAQVVARARNLVGWTSEVVVRSLGPGETTTRIKGLCSLGGEGMVFVDGR